MTDQCKAAEEAFNKLGLSNSYWNVFRAAFNEGVAWKNKNLDPWIDVREELGIYLSNEEVKAWVYILQEKNLNPNKVLTILEEKGISEWGGIDELINQCWS